MPACRQTLVIGLLTAIAASNVANAETSAIQAQLIEQGQYWQARSNAVRAAEIWQKVLQQDPNQVDALYGMGLIGVNKNQPQQAQSYLARLRAPDAAACAGDPAGAGYCPDPGQTTRRCSMKPGVWPMPVSATRRQGCFASCSTAVCRRGTIGREYYTNLGFSDNDWPEARQGFERLIKQNPNDSVLALFYAKHLARREGTREEGIRTLARLTTHPDIAGDADQSWRLALVWGGGADSSASTLVRSVPQGPPGRPGNPRPDEQGPATAGRWAVVPPGSRTRTWPRGLKALEKGDLATAETAFNARLKTKADDADALGGLGVVRQQQNRHAEAEQLLTRATRQTGGERWKSALDNVQDLDPAATGSRSASQGAGQQGAGGCSGGGAQEPG